MRTTCRACDGALTNLWDLGDLYVSNFPKDEKEDCYKDPLVLARCNQCLLVQLADTFPREKLYEHYWYRSGVNESMVAHLEGIAAKAAEMTAVGPGETVIDIGANDGTLLGLYPTYLVRLAFEPARNLHPELLLKCNAIAGGFFPEDARVYPPRQAKIITSIAMFYDLEDPGAFAAEVKRLLHPEGVWVCEMHYLPQMLETNGFDAICHEHLTYWSFTSFNRLLAKYGLQVIDVDLNTVNGGSACYYITHQEGRVAVEPGAFRRIQELQAVEELLGLDTNTPYLEFIKRCYEIRAKIRKFFLQALLANLTVDVYGASTKGNTLLQWVGVDQSQVRWAIERSKEKHGRMTVGTWIQIVGEEEGRGRPLPTFGYAPSRDLAVTHPVDVVRAADVWLCPIWHFKDSVLRREREFLERGGKILFPLPEPVMVEFVRDQGCSGVKAGGMMIQRPLV